MQSKLVLLAVLSAIAYAQALSIHNRPDQSEVLFNPNNPEDVVKLARDSIPRIHQKPVERPNLVVFQKNTCLPGQVRVTVGLKSYSNPNSYNERGQKCDWTPFGTQHCDPIFETSVHYTNQNGQSVQSDRRNGPYDDVMTLNWSDSDASITVCAATNTYVRLQVKAIDDDVTTASEIIGHWEFQFAAYSGFARYETSKRSERSGAYVTAFVQP